MSVPAVVRRLRKIKPLAPVESAPWLPDRLTVLSTLMTQGILPPGLWSMAGSSSSPTVGMTFWDSGWLIASFCGGNTQWVSPRSYI